MAKAKQLPSGQWRTLVYSHTEIINGKKKRIYESFTAETKRESEYLAARFAMDKTSISHSRTTVEQALNLYIDSKSNILSPSTIRSYRLNTKNHLNGIKSISVDKLTQAMVQAEVNTMRGEGLSPKTIRNIYGLLVSAIKDVRPELTLKCLLPQKVKPDISIPTPEELNILITMADSEMKLVIKLAAYMGLRRSEICALNWDDIDLKNKKLSINKALVLNNENLYVTKGTKTSSSTRVIDIPDTLLLDLQKIKPQKGQIISLSPLCVTKRFLALVKKAGFSNYRFHDLRHYYASIMLMLGVPDKYAMERMGHSTNNMLKTVYQHTFESEQAKITDKLNIFFKATTN